MRPGDKRVFDYSGELPALIRKHGETVTIMEVFQDEVRIKFRDGQELTTWKEDVREEASA